jgi:hypothetical protein
MINWVYLNKCFSVFPKLCSTSISQNLQLQPVLAFVIENYDLQAIRQEFEESIRRATALSYAFRFYICFLLYHSNI